MSCTIMQGYISDEINKEHQEVFSEGSNASEYLEYYLPKDGDYKHFVSDTSDVWVQLRNIKGRLWIEVGEPAA